MVQAASYPPLHRTQERGTHSAGTGRENRKGHPPMQMAARRKARATRPYLYEIKHVNFFVSAAVGILGGSLVMLLGAGIAVACKSPKPERH